MSVTLVEVLPELVKRAGTPRGCRRRCGGGRVRWLLRAYVGLATVPADVVLLVGVLGNVSDAGVAATVAAMPRPPVRRGPRWCGAAGAAWRAPTTS